MANKEQPAAKPIIVLSGPPGAGKSTVAGELVGLSTGPMACIEGDKFWSFFAKDWKNMAENRNFITLMTSATAASLSYARAGYETVLDFSVPPWFLPTVYKIVNGRGLSLHYVVLFPSRQICAQRAATRAEGALGDYTHYDDFYDTFQTAGAYLISDDLCSAAETAARIREGLDKGSFLVTEQNLPKPKNSVSG